MQDDESESLLSGFELWASLLKIVPFLLSYVEKMNLTTRPDNPESLLRASRMLVKSVSDKVTSV